jgi:hypothetical protein
MATIKVTPRSLTDAYKTRQGDASPNLVGLQFTNGSSIFTFGNFEITSNFQPKLAKDFMLGGEWSDYYSLNNLNLTQETSTALLSNDLNVRLNFNPLNIDRYVYFGSFYELTKVTVETIIQKWKGSVYVNPQNNTNAILNTILYTILNTILNTLLSTLASDSGLQPATQTQLTTLQTNLAQLLTA